MAQAAKPQTQSDPPARPKPAPAPVTAQQAATAKGTVFTDFASI